MRNLPAELQHKVLTQLDDCRDVLSYCSTHKHNECDWPRLVEDWYRDDAPPGYDFGGADAATARSVYQKQCLPSTLATRVLRSSSLGFGFVQRRTVAQLV